MSTSLFLFGAAMLVGSGFLMGLTWMELDVKWSGFKLVGESTLGRNSINWLAGIALLTAVAVCSLAS